MPLSHIEHLLVAADDIDATRDWYARVLGMTSGPHPDFGFPVHWMYLNGVDVVHIGPSAKMAGAIQKQYLGRTSQASGQGTGAIDHIAFRATGLRDDRLVIERRLRRHRVTFGEHRVPSRANGHLEHLVAEQPHRAQPRLRVAAHLVAESGRTG